MALTRPHWLAIVSTIVLIAGGAVTLTRLGEHPNAVRQPTVPLQSAAAPESPPTEDPNVLIRIESTPPGAAIVRVSTRSVLGYTPETVQFPKSRESVQLRFELPGFAAETRELPTASDGELKVVLKARAIGSRPPRT